MNNQNTAILLPVGVAELVVIPGDQLHERWRQLDAGLGVHNGGPEIRIKTFLENLKTVMWVQTYNFVEKKYLVSPRKSVETTMSVVYPRMPLRGPASLAAFST